MNHSNRAKVVAFGWLLLFLALPEITTAQDLATPILISGKHGNRLVFTPRSNARVAINAYVTERHKILDNLADRSPNEVIEAQVSYSHYLNKTELLDAINKYRTQTLSLNVGWGEQVGGYEIKKHEPVEHAINNAAFHHTMFVNELYESAHNEFQQNTQEIRSPEALERLSTHLAHAKELKVQLEKRGVLFYGARIKGRTSEIRRIKDTDKLIRLVDPIWAEDTGSVEIINSKRISVPLSPYQYESSH